MEQVPLENGVPTVKSVGVTRWATRGIFPYNSFSTKKYFGYWVEQGQIKKKTLFEWVRGVYLLRTGSNQCPPLFLSWLLRRLRVRNTYGQFCFPAHSHISQLTPMRSALFQDITKRIATFWDNLSVPFSCRLNTLVVRCITTRHRSYIKSG